MGRRARRDGLTVWAAPSDESAVTRLGLAVPAGGVSAVARNRVRRRIRAIVARYDAAPGFDVVVRADETATGKTFQELTTDLGSALEAVGVETQ